MLVRGIRGATTVESNTREEILDLLAGPPDTSRELALLRAGQPVAVKLVLGPPTQLPRREPKAQPLTPPLRTALWVEKTTSRRRTKKTGMKIRGNGN